MSPLARRFLLIALLLSPSLPAPAADCDGDGSAFERLPSRTAILREHGIMVGNIKDKDFAVWNPEISTVAVRTLIDGSTTATKKVTMSMARIFDELLPHQHLATEIYFITKGTAKMTIGDRTVTLTPGMFLYLPEGIPHHTVIDPGDEPLEILFVFGKDTLGDVEYIHDNSLTPSTEIPLVGHITPPIGERKFVNRHVNSSAETEEGLEFHQVYLPEAHSHRMQDPDSPNTIFIESGSGTIEVAGETIPVQAGDYVYIPQGELFELTGSNRFNALVFGTNPP